MNLEIQSPTHHSISLTFDWQKDLQSLEREATVSEETGQRDDLALIDAECSLDLIDADLAAVGRASVDLGTKEQTRRRLTAWRRRMARLIDRLRAVGP